MRRSDSRPASLATTRQCETSMPTRYSAQAYRPAPNWLSTWDSMYRKLEPDAVQILKPTGFYERYDLEVPDMVAGRQLAGEERAAIERVSTALTIAADAA